jgi:tyrosyl-tRNA synthetase
MYGKVMSLPDEALPQWWEMVIGGGPHPDEPMGWKLELARRVVARWHGEEGAAAGEAHFTRVVRERGAPEEIPPFALPDGDPVHLPAVLASAFGLSTSEARRLVAQGAVKLEGEALRDLDLPRARLEGGVLQAGKRRFVRLSAS